MITDKEIRLIALFFFYSFLEDGPAIEASGRAVARFKGELPRIPADAESPARTRSLLRCCLDVWKSMGSGTLSLKHALRPSADFQVSPAMDLSRWLRFRQEGLPDESLALLLHRVLEFSEEDISAVLGVSVGTVRHRVAHGLQTLAAGNQGRS